MTIPDDSDWRTAEPDDLDHAYARRMSSGDRAQDVAPLDREEPGA